MVTSFVVLFVCVLGAIFWLIGTRNRLAELRNQVLYTWAEVDLQLQRRELLTDTLLKDLREQASYRQETLDQAHVALQTVLALRQQIWQAGGPISASLKELQQAESDALGAAAELRTLVDEFPAIKEGSSWEQLEAEWDGLDQTLQIAIKTYNESVEHYNHRQGQMPASLMAKRLGHQQVELFQPQIKTTTPASL